MRVQSIGCRIGALSLALFAFAPDRVDAHQLKSALTEVQFNPRSCAVEIVHRFHLHDVEQAAEQLLGRAVDLLNDSGAQAELAQRLSADFALGSKARQANSLRYVGEEVEGKFLWVYQEWMPSADVPEQLWFQHSALQSIWPDQENQINLGAGSVVRSLAFRAGDSWKSLPAHVLQLPKQCDGGAAAHPAPAPNPPRNPSSTSDE